MSSVLVGYTGEHHHSHQWGQIAKGRRPSKSSSSFSCTGISPVGRHVSRSDYPSCVPTEFAGKRARTRNAQKEKVYRD